MRVIANCLRLRPRENKLANECRIWMQVICVSELADIGGISIPIEKLQGQWQARPDSGITWSNQPKPTKAHWSALRRCLRQTFYTKASPWQQSGSYKLDVEMGPWFIVPRHILYDSYASKSHIYWRDEISCYKCNKTSTTKIYNIDYDSQEEPPAELIPIATRYVKDNKLWVWKHFRHHAL